VYPQCRVFGAKALFTLNGVPTTVGSSWDMPRDGPVNSTVLKATQLGLNKTNAGECEPRAAAKSVQQSPGCAGLSPCPVS
jgi:hypothetical protein